MTGVWTPSQVLLNSSYVLFAKKWIVELRSNSLGNYLVDLMYLKALSPSSTPRKVAGRGKGLVLSLFSASLIMVPAAPDKKTDSPLLNSSHSTILPFTNFESNEFFLQYLQIHNHI